MEVLDILLPIRISWDIPVLEKAKISQVLEHRSLGHIFNARFAGLQILYTLLQNVAQEETAAQSFYQTYFCDILQHIFSVVTDTSHTAGERTCLPLNGRINGTVLNVLFSITTACVWL